MATTSSQPILRSERPDTAVDSLKHLIANIPDWRKRLNELNSEPEAHSGDTPPPPGDANGTKTVEEQSQPTSTADCDNARVFFQGLSEFVSMSRTMIRPAKMTAKIAQIKRLAELEYAEDGECEGRIPSSGMLMALGSPMYSKTSQSELDTRGPNSPGLDLLQAGIYDDLDGGLRNVQKMCEHAARQLLRDDIDRQLHEIKELADREMRRIKGDLDQLMQPGQDSMRARAYRPPGMRRDLAPGAGRGTERGAG